MAESDILKCGLCNHLLNFPKSLLCLHLFCASCLYEFVSSETKKSPTEGPKNLQCPVCEIKFSFSENIRNSEFVRQLPTNDHINAIIKREGLILNGTLCRPCKRMNRIQKTSIWCVECEEGLCEECRKIHSTTEAVMFHRTVDMKDSKAQNIPINVDISCMTHKDKKIAYFCEDHKQLCCHTCATIHHRMCNHLVTLKDAARESKQKNETSNLIQKLDDDLGALNYDINERDIFLNQIEKDRDDMKSKIASFRKEINNRLDELEHKFNKDFELLHDQNCTAINTKRDEIKNTRTVISNCKRLLQIVLKRNSDISIFLEKETIERKLKEQEDIMAKLSLEPTFKFQYKANFAPELTHLVTSVQSLGTVKCVNVTRVQSIVNDVLVLKPPTTSKSNGQLQKLMTFTSKKCKIDTHNGVEQLPDGRILSIHNANQSLYLFDNNGNLQTQIRLPGNPRDLTMINDSETAVTYYNGLPSCPTGVCIVNINTKAIKLNILHGIKDLQGVNVHGIASLGDKLIIACYDRIIIVDVTRLMMEHADKIIIAEIKTPSPNSHNRYVTSITNNVFRMFCYTNRADGSVVYMDIKGSNIVKYTHDALIDPSGITSDGDGTIYITGHASNNVHQISSDGTLLKILLSADDDITCPYAINFNFQTSRLALTHSKSKISVYQV